MSESLRVGVIDSGLAEDAELPVAAACHFALGDDGAVARHPGAEDSLGHGTEVSKLICAVAPEAVLLHAQVFGGGFQTAPLLVAAALDWLADERAAVVNMSFGLAADREVLREACAAAAARGLVLIASAPARGEACYPAAYPEVIAVTGDARCAEGEVTDLQGVQADLGTWCASPERGGGIIAGASVAAAHLTGLTAALLAAGAALDREALLTFFRAAAIAVGPERRSADPTP